MYLAQPRWHKNCRLWMAVEIRLLLRKINNRPRRFESGRRINDYGRLDTASPQNGGSTRIEEVKSLGWTFEFNDSRGICRTGDVPVNKLQAFGQAKSNLDLRPFICDSSCLIQNVPDNSLAHGGILLDNQSFLVSSEIDIPKPTAKISKVRSEGFFWPRSTLDM